MKRFQLLIIGLVLAYAAYSQDAKPFQFEDQQALTIDASALEQLTAPKRWRAERRLFFLDSENYTRRPSSGFISFKKGGGCDQFCGPAGNWTVVGEQILTIELPEAPGCNINYLIGGNYAIYEISADQLIISKVLTSNQKNKIVYVLTPDNEEEYARSKAKAPPKFISQDQEGIASEMTEEQVRDRLRKEYFMRAMPVPEGFYEMSFQELEQKLVQLLLGN